MVTEEGFALVILFKIKRTIRTKYVFIEGVEKPFIKFFYFAFSEIQFFFSLCDKGYFSRMSLLTMLSHIVTY